MEEDPVKYDTYEKAIARYGLDSWKESSVFDDYLTSKTFVPRFLSVNACHDVYVKLALTMKVLFIPYHFFFILLF